MILVDYEVLGLIMAFRFLTLTYCLAGCAIANLAGLIIAMKFGHYWFHFAAVLVFPPLFCLRAGVVDPNQLIKIGCYSLVGLVLGCSLLTPGVAMRRESVPAYIALLPYAGFGPQIGASYISSLLAVVGAFFAPISRKKNALGVQNRE